MSDSGNKDPYDPNRPDEPSEPQWGAHPPAPDQPSPDHPSSGQPSDQPSSSGWSGGQLGSWGQQQGGEQPEGQPPQYGQPAPPYAGGQFGAQPQYGQPQYGQPQYGQPQYGGPVGSPPPNHLVWAILSTLFCCLPLGIVSIVYAAQVNGKYTSGDVAGAQESSRKAKQFAIWSAVVGLIVAALYVVAVIAMASSSTS